LHQVSFSREDTDRRVAEFEKHRGRLFGLAYRMLGLQAEAEDIVQEAYLRWHAADVDSLRTPEAWLVTVATRLCIDRLRALQAERRNYVGEWLPEPIVVETRPSMRPDHASELAEDLSIAFLYLLQRLGPEERAALLLHDVFDCGYPEIARVLDKTEVAVRQIVRRARERVRTDRPRFEVTEEKHREMIERFVQAVRTVDEQALMALFAADATWTSDGGGKAAAAINVLRGNEKISKFMAGVARKGREQAGAVTLKMPRVNGMPALAVYLSGKLFAVYQFVTDGDKIHEVYAVLNPDKLTHVGEA